MRRAGVVNEYGYEDTSGRQALYCLVSSSPNNQGFYLRIADDGIWLRHVNGASIAQWSGRTLIQRFREEFWFDEAHPLPIRTYTTS